MLQKPTKRSDRNKPIKVRWENLLFAKNLNVNLNARRNYCDLKTIYSNFTSIMYFTVHTVNTTEILNKK
jgi:hypothetical protein